MATDVRFKFDIKDFVGNRASKMTGVIVGQCVNICGCIMYEVQPHSMDPTKLPDTFWSDEDITYLATAVDPNPRGDDGDGRVR